MQAFRGCVAASGTEWSESLATTLPPILSLSARYDYTSLDYGWSVLCEEDCDVRARVEEPPLDAAPSSRF